MGLANKLILMVYASVIIFSHAHLISVLEMYTFCCIIMTPWLTNNSEEYQKIEDTGTILLRKKIWVI